MMVLEDAGNLNRTRHGVSGHDVNITTRRHHVNGQCLYTPTLCRWIPSERVQKLPPGGRGL